MGPLGFRPLPALRREFKAETIFSGVLPWSPRNTLAQSLWLARSRPSLTLPRFPVQHDLRRITRFRGDISLRFLPTAGSYALETCLTYSPRVGAPYLTRNNRDRRGSAWVGFSGPDFWTPHPRNTPAHSLWLARSRPFSRRLFFPSNTIYYVKPASGGTCRFVFSLRPGATPSKLASHIV